MTAADGEWRREIAERIRSRSHEIATGVTADFLDRHPEWRDRYGELAWERGVEDAAFHVQFLAGAVVAADAESFGDYARWTSRVLAARGISPEFVAENLHQVGEAVVRGLSEDERTLIAGIVDAGIVAVATEPDTPDESEAGPLRTERSLYLQAIRNGARRTAVRVVMEALRSGVPVPDIYLHVLQPAQYEIGRLWERNEITVAKEHMATAITQYVIAQLYSHLVIPARSRGNALLTGVRGELHQLGSNMVADILEADGWNMRFLGTQLPHEGVLDAVAEHEPLLLGISATVLFNLPAAADLIEAVRARFGPEIRILVGGAAFYANPDVWREMGADGIGRDLKDAVTVADRLFSESGD